MMRLTLYSFICGGLIAGTILGYTATRPLAAARDASISISGVSAKISLTTSTIGKIRALSPDGYAILEAEDPLDPTRSISFLGKIDSPATIPSLRVGDYVHTEITRTPGAIRFTQITIVPEKTLSTL